MSTEIEHLQRALIERDNRLINTQQSIEVAYATLVTEGIEAARGVLGALIDHHTQPVSNQPDVMRLVGKLRERETVMLEVLTSLDSAGEHNSKATIAKKLRRRLRELGVIGE